ncbi:MAG: zf-HC2 domain-containing protein [Bryobacteraceae bacterium]
MSTVHGAHLDEDMVESYALGKLSEPEESLVEEHLLVCESCRQQVELEDDFVRAFRMADTRLRSAEATRPSSWVGRLLRFRPLHLSAAFAVCCMLIVLYRPSTPDADVSLVATRGAFDSIQTVAAGANLTLTLDARGLPQAGSVVAELAGPDGAVLWTSTERMIGDQVTIRPAAKLASGVYWVRLYTADSSRTLLREFGLRAK